MNILITGIDGFVGSHLAEYILKNHEECKVFGTRQIHSNIEYNNLSKEVLDKVTIIDCDLRDRNSVLRALCTAMPDKIFHLAAQSFVKASWENPEYTLYNNIISQLNILEVIREVDGLDPIIQIACSSEEYGNVPPEDMPIKETQELLPLSPYAVSKVTQEKLGYQYHKSYGLKVIITRTFNHEGPRRGTQFVTASFAKQFADIEKGNQDPVLYVGNLEAMRDFTDVRDVVRAYWLATEKCEYGEPYNICSMNKTPIKRIIEILKELCSKDVEIKEDPDRMRPSDLEVLYGDNTKFCEKTGWQPEIPFKKTMEDLFNYHLNNNK